MNVKTILNYPSLANARLVAGFNGVFNKVGSVMILESPDVEHWGKRYEVIVTNYFALSKLDSVELEEFFNKLMGIGISAIIFKLNRMVSSIPDLMIYFCNQLNIPLITIDESVNYEQLMIDIMGPIIDEHASLLQRFYTTHQHFLNLELQLPSIEEALESIEALLHNKVAFVDDTEDTCVASDPTVHFTTQKEDLGIDNRFVVHTYDRITGTLNDKTEVQGYAVSIPNLENKSYKLLIFETQQPLISEDFMIIESAVSFLQTALLHKYSSQRTQFIHKNNIMMDLLNARYYDAFEQNEMLTMVNLNHKKYYQGFMISLQQTKESEIDLSNHIIYLISQRFRSKYPHCAFFEKNYAITFLFNHDNENGLDKSTLDHIIRDIIDQYASSFNFYLAVSQPHQKETLYRINKECLNTMSVQRKFDQANQVVAYQDLNILRVFLETNTLHRIDDFVPIKFTRLRDEKPELYNTLHAFIQFNQNHVQAANYLFLHPKTVRYRLERVKEILEIDFNNPNDVFECAYSLRVLNLKDSIN
ncbi:hypothetical protein AOC36_07410 [Erysipelothrix larvae]|uniref:PucR family transcriptional regulator n=1 Tax=Erysipelothrix larvae TaxID=1514105 RepID=A0A0X8H0J6_9FIRM|nr:PucR family transcriptional regulator [Erysipelothrix larvae]AMC93816.1 hypothetical protein AOC36_07410 [Erysipelothrix larvae]